MNTDKGKHRERMKFPANQKIAKREVITDQSDPRMIKFRKEHGEFEPGYPRKTIKLEITEYEAGPDESKLVTKIGFYEGEPPPGYRAFFDDLFKKAMLEVIEEQATEKWSQDLHINIRDYLKKDRKYVLQLWKECNLTHPWEEPAMDIKRILEVSPDLFLVGVIDDKIIATGMGRCDENRGWVEYLCVTPTFRKKGIARHLLKIIEDRLLKRGCSEVNLLIDTDNATAIEFFQSVGYHTNSVTLMGKHLGNN
jgi:ribosomal protein S18 acetylase RimI-like enzyme